MTETRTLEERGNGSQMITGCPKGDQHVCDEEGPFLSKCLKMGVVDCQYTWLAHTMALVLAQHCGHQKQIICFKKKNSLLTTDHLPHLRIVSEHLLLVTGNRLFTSNVITCLKGSQIWGANLYWWECHLVLLTLDFGNVFTPATPPETDFHYLTINQHSFSTRINKSNKLPDLTNKYAKSCLLKESTIYN